MRSYEKSWDEETPSTTRSPVPWLALALAVVACLLAGASFFRQQAAIDAGRIAEVRAKRVEHELGVLRQSAALTDSRLRSAQASIRKRSASVAPLAARVLKSVFTVEAGNSLGTGFLAWTNEDGSYLLTANHVVEGESRSVTITRRGGTWGAEVVPQDRTNDLALLRANGRPTQAAPLWQSPRRNRARTGEQLLLVGSPFGLGGSVTTGIVSRVTPQYVQTDAAANPGNSGGPAVDRDGNVVGILVMGGGENVNFAVRIERACARLRRC
jgi:S1-C subfamily serine protease